MDSSVRFSRLRKEGVEKGRGNYLCWNTLRNWRRQQFQQRERAIIESISLGHNNSNWLGDDYIRMARPSQCPLRRFLRAQRNVNANRTHFRLATFHYQWQQP